MEIRDMQVTLSWKNKKTNKKEEDMAKRIISSLHFSPGIAIILIAFLVLASGETVYAHVSNTDSSPETRRRILRAMSEFLNDKQS